MAVDWTAVGAIATGVGAIVAAASAVVVAWQAKETRKAAQAAVDSVVLGRSALVVSQTATVEATKTRFDARAPRLRINPKDVLGEDPAIFRHGEWVKWTDVKDVVRRTRDDSTMIRVGATFEITNEGHSSVYVSFAPGHHASTEETEPVVTDPGKLALAPGESITRRLGATATLERLAGAWSGTASKKEPLRSFVTLLCSDLYDDGVVDKWSLELIARPVEAVPDDLGAWRVRDARDTPGPVEARVVHVERTYFASKSQREKLAPPEVVTELRSAERANTIPGELTARVPKQNKPAV